MITLESKNKIKDLATKENKEVVGFVIDSTPEIIVPLQNHAKNPKQNFEINPRDLLAVEKIGKIKCLFHSHLSENVNFSDLDKKNLLLNEWNGLVYSVSKDEFNELNISKYKKYLGIKFEIGVNDCFTLVKNYYKNELNIDLKNVERSDGWFIKNSNLIITNAQNQGFSLVKTSALKEHNILAFDTLRSGKINHLGIYLKNDIILHQPRKKFSRLELLSYSYEKFLIGVFERC